MAEIIKKDDLEGQMKAQEVAERRKSAFLPSRGVISREVVTAAEQAAALIQEARQQSQAIIAQAKAMQEQMAEQVESERQRGFDEGRQEGLGEVTEILSNAVTTREQLLADAEPEVVRMVMQIAEKILGDAIQQGAVVSVVKQALSEAIGERVTVRVHPEDLEKVRDTEPVLKERLQNVKSLKVVSDESIERGGCAVDTEVGTIDAQLSTQLAAIRKSLGLSE